MDISLEQFCNAFGFDQNAMERIRPMWAQLVSSWDGKIPATATEDFFFKWYPYVKGPDAEEIRPRLRRVIEALNRSPELACYLHLLIRATFFPQDKFNFNFLPPVAMLGEDDGVFILLAALCGAPYMEAAYAKNGVPRQYFLDALSWIGGAMQLYMLSHDGIPGFRLVQLYVLQYQVTGEMYRIGRLEFLMHKVPDYLPAIYRNASGKLAVLCRPGLLLSHKGQTLPANARPDQIAATSFLREDGNTISGIPITPDGYAQVGRVLTIDKREYAPVCSPWDLVPSIHIPGGSRLPWSSVLESMKNAYDFFKRYFHRDVPMFVCCSWIFNPIWERLVPNGNIAAFRREVYAVHGWPPAPNGRSGMDFAYGRNDLAPDQLPAKTRLQELVRQAYVEEKMLRFEGMFVLTSDLDKLGGQYYRTHCQLA